MYLESRYVLSEVQIVLMFLSIALFGGMVSMDKNPMLGPHYHALDLMA
jgi:hypothetical protein